MGVILAARSRLVASGTVSVLVNDDREISMPVGVRLLQGLSDAGILVPSACAGGAKKSKGPAPGGGRRETGS